ncbi:MAG: hypothetical protein ACREIV_02985, partial [Planctomycetaceae bacterium]
MTQASFRRTALSGLLFAALAATGCRHCSPWSGLHHWWWSGHSWSVPETLPLGSVVRAHYYEMESNGEAADFIIHRHEFVGKTTHLTPDGRDHIAEIAARAPETPFPVIIERSEDNSNPQLDAARRVLVARVLTDLGVPNADGRTFVAPAYGKARNGVEAESDYYNYLGTRGGGFGGTNNSG